MKTIDWHLETGLNGCDLSGSVEVEDTAADAEIEAEVKEDMWNQLSLTWHERGKA